MADADRLERLERLNRLRLEGALSAEEFEREKQVILTTGASERRPISMRPASGLVPTLVAGAVLVLLIGIAISWLALRPPQRAAAAGRVPAVQPPGSVPVAANSATASPVPVAAAPPPPPKTPQPEPAVDLSPFAGKYAFDRVGGRTFLNHPQVRAAVARAVPDRTVRRWVLSSATSGPIDILGERLLYWGCEPHNCGSHNWSIVIDRRGRRANVCYFDENALAPGPRWHPSSAGVYADQGGCPHDF